MTWTRLDDGIYDHPKVAEVDDPAAVLLWIWSMAWSNRHGTDGHLPAKSIRVLAAHAKVTDLAEAARQLCDAGLWDETDGGWEIHDFLDYQPAAEQVDDLRRKRSEAGRKGGRRSGETRRTEATPQANDEASASAVASPLLKQSRTPSRPDPIAIYSSSGPVQQGISTGRDDDDPDHDDEPSPPPPAAAVTTDPAWAVALELGQRDSRRSPTEVRAVGPHALSCARTRWAVQGGEITALARAHPDLAAWEVADLVEAQALAMAAHPGGGAALAQAVRRPPCPECGQDGHDRPSCPWVGMTADEITEAIEESRRWLEAIGEEP